MTAYQGTMVVKLPPSAPQLSNHPTLPTVPPGWGGEQQSVSPLQRSLTGFKTHSLPDETVPWPAAPSPLPLP